MLANKTENRRDIFICVMAIFGAAGGFMAVHFASDHLGDGLSLPVRMALCAAIGTLGIILAAVLFAGTFFLVSAIKRTLGKLHERPRCKGTYGREFLLLLDRDARKTCLREWTGLPHGSRVIWYILVGILVFLSFRCISDYYNGPISSDNVLLGCFLFGFCWIIVSYEACCFLSDVLLPIYRQRQRDKAQAERDAITQRIKAKLPQARYRVSGSIITSIDQLRRIASEGGLPEELVPDAEDLGRAERELVEAEADLTAMNAKQTSASRTTT